MGNNDSQSYITLLIDTLKKQEIALADVLEITKEQSKIANAPEFDEVLLENSLNRKEILIAKLNELDDGFVSVYGRVRNEIQGNTETYKTQIRQMQDLIKKCTDLGVEIKVLEERNRNQLMKCFASKNKKYSSQRNAAMVASRYHRTMYPGRGTGNDFTS